MKIYEHRTSQLFMLLNSSWRCIVRSWHSPRALWSTFRHIKANSEHEEQDRFPGC